MTNEIRLAQSRPLLSGSVWMAPPFASSMSSVEFCKPRIDNGYSYMPARHSWTLLSLSVGDATASIILTARNEQISHIKEGATLVLRNAKVVFQTTNQIMTMRKRQYDFPLFAVLLACLSPRWTCSRTTCAWRSISGDWLSQVLKVWKTRWILIETCLSSSTCLCLWTARSNLKHAHKDSKVSFISD